MKKINRKLNNRSGIYCILNVVNGKMYIGSTARTLYLRYHQHLYELRNSKSNCGTLQKAIDKYTLEKFAFLILEYCNNVEEREQHYIDTLKPEYNIRTIAANNIGCKHSESSKSKKKLGEHKDAKEVDKYSINGKYIESYTSIKEAAIANNVKCSSKISGVCTGKTFSIKGFRWSFKGEPLNNRSSRVSQLESLIVVEKDGIEEHFEKQSEVAEYINNLGFKCRNSTISYYLNKNKPFNNFNIYYL